MASSPNLFNNGGFLGFEVIFDWKLSHLDESLRAFNSLSQGMTSNVGGTNLKGKNVMKP